MEIPRTAADIRSMTAAESRGIRMPLLQQAAAARNMSMLIMTERNSSFSKIPHLRLIICARFGDCEKIFRLVLLYFEIYDIMFARRTLYNFFITFKVQILLS